MELLLCDNCNTHSSFKYSHTVITRCGLCNAILSKNKRNDLLENKIQLLNEPYFDLIGKSIEYKNEKYELTGFIRYYYSEGYLYKWSAYCKDKYIWLCESLGCWFILQNVSNNEYWNWKVFKPNYTFNYQGRDYRVDSLSAFYSLAIEGELPELQLNRNKGISIECSNAESLIQFNLYEKDSFEMLCGTSVNVQDLNIS